MATTATAFSPFKKNLAARLIEVDLATNLPIKIDTWSINKNDIETDDLSNLEVTLDHSYPRTSAEVDSLSLSMPDLSPSSYASYVEQIE